ncbi:hypothetical protein M3J09_009896 [Ascochyta lentis]
MTQPVDLCRKRCDSPALTASWGQPHPAFTISDEEVEAPWQTFCSRLPEGASSNTMQPERTPAARNPWQGIVASTTSVSSYISCTRCHPT